MTFNAGESASDFQLKWKIVNPFAPWLIQENSFVIQYPDLHRWDVELLRLARNFNSLRFLCSIVYNNVFEPEVTADCMEIVCTLNGTPVHRNLVYDYPFSGETRYLHSFEVEIEDHGESAISVLAILVYVDVKKGGIVEARAQINGSGIQLLYGGESIDMDSLTVALRGSQLYSSYCTMSIFSSDNRETSVHHCILQVRWANLLTDHNLNENSNFVNTNISFLVLSNIIHYMYTGQVDTHSVIWNYPPFITEFFQVIWRYQILHLYEALRQNDMRMSRYAVNYVDTRRISISLHYVRGIQLREQSMAFPVYVYPYADNHPGSSAHSFLFTVHIRHENPAGPWLSYSMLSQTEIPFAVHVRLEMPGNEGLIRLVHSSDYNIPGNERIATGPILFLGSPETFFEDSQDHDGNEIYKKLFFGLTFADRTSSVSIWHLSNPVEVMREPWEILSQHMRDVLRRQFKTDLVVQPRSIRNGCEVPSHRIHKAIFNARLPGWRNVIEPHLPEGAALPDTVTLPLSNESYHLVISYMYTGTMLFVPSALHQEILNFAFDSDFVSLQRLIYSMRS